MPGTRRGFCAGPFPLSPRARGRASASSSPPAHEDRSPAARPGAHLTSGPGWGHLCVGNRAGRSSGPGWGFPLGSPHEDWMYSVARRKAWPWAADPRRATMGDPRWQDRPGWPAAASAAHRLVAEPLCEARRTPTTTPRSADGCRCVAGAPLHRGARSSGPDDRIAGESGRERERFTVHGLVRPSVPEFHSLLCAYNTPSCRRSEPARRHLRRSAEAVARLVAGGRAGRVAEARRGARPRLNPRGANIESCP